jgi:GTP-binding protein
VAFSLWKLQERGPLFIGPGVEIYTGMVIGEHNRGTDLVVNATKNKQLTNMRASGADEALNLIPPQEITLEKAIEYIQGDEYVEVTPKSIRLRKKYLDENERKKHTK